jgi:hypothetical protein
MPERATPDARPLRPAMRAHARSAT